LQDRLETEPETMDAETLLSVAKFGADRSGHGPQSRQTNVNINVNLADRLSAARKRVSSPQTEGAEEPPPFLELQANAKR
jgi:coproporphyrinogen III oxidase-like Fe-S oxidoreductase